MLIHKSELGFYLLGLHFSAATPVDDGSPELGPGMSYPASSWLDSACLLINKFGKIVWNMDARILCINSKLHGIRINYIFC